ncbi:MAG: YraN family protein [Gammaproteobacteria bacterium]
MKPVAAHLRHGKAAEALAARYLGNQGLQLLTANFRARFGELDLVLRDGRILVVVEVRARRDARRIQPAATVDRYKQRRLIGATRYYLLRHRQYAQWPVRFDVLEVLGELAAPEIRWHRAAFSLDDMAGN